MTKNNQQAEQQQPAEPRKQLLFINYRGKITEDYVRALIKMTIRKMKTLMPSLKATTEKGLKSGVVYQITCPQCSLCYVGQTSRHLVTRFKEHLRKNAPVSQHLHQCNAQLSVNDTNILSCGTKNLMTLEALWIDELKPALNTKDEFRSRTLTIKL